MSLTTSIHRFVRKRRLYPANLFDRIQFWISISSLVFLLALRLSAPGILEDFRSHSPFFNWRLIVFAHLTFLVMTYISQDPQKDEFEGYTAAITDIENIGKRLFALVKFLEQERQRVAEAEATFHKLELEKTELEPVVLAHRETVNAILLAHAKTTASRAWKERALGFMSGMLTSLLAAMVFEYLRR